MKLIHPLLIATLSLSTLNSCIQDEPLNAECDITGVDETWLQEHRNILSTDPNIENQRVTFTLANRNIDRSAFDPKFTLTPGAHITANIDGKEVEGNGIIRNFNNPQTYTTHSQDGAWKKDYEVMFSYPPIITEEWNLGFESFELDPSRRFYEWFEMDAATGERNNIWSSGNPGYDLTRDNIGIQEYPTVAIDNGVQGKGLKLTTRATGWNMMKMPIAAGNLFIGTFNASKAAMGQTQALQATQFGLPLVTKKPLRLEGYYKYKAGEDFTNANFKVQPTLHDTADIYAVVYEIASKSEMEADPTKKFVALNGKDVLNSKRIVLLARIDKPVEFQGNIENLEESEWIHFSEEFKPMNGKEFSLERMADRGYAIAVVMTSSREGAYFKGAVGSTLYVDEIKIINEK